MKNKKWQPEMKNTKQIIRYETFNGNPELIRFRCGLHLRLSHDEYKQQVINNKLHPFSLAFSSLVIITVIDTIVWYVSYAQFFPSLKFDMFGAVLICTVVILRSLSHGHGHCLWEITLYVYLSKYYFYTNFNCFCFFTKCLNNNK